MNANVSARPVAIVTGAGRGIGRACALALADAGFHLLLNDLAGGEEIALLRRLGEELDALGVESLAFPASVAALDRHAAMLDAARARWGRMDCFVNNAGVSVERRGDLLTVTPESYDRCMSVNARAVFFLSQAAASSMLEQGELGGQHRSIVNITSSNAVAASIGRGEYCASKAAASMTTKLFALRLAADGIGVYEVRPGIIDTAMTRPVKDLYDARIRDGLVPMGRWGSPEDVASTVRCMAEGRLRYTVGEAIAVDGGLTMPHF